MVELRLDRRLQARVDASDVIQDAYLEIAARLAEYLRHPELPLLPVRELARERRRALLKADQAQYLVRAGHVLGAAVQPQQPRETALRLDG